jgi:signal transduction histidine kinase
MQQWIEANALVVAIALAAIAVVLAVLGVIAFIAFRVARRKLNREIADRVLLERDRIDLEVTLAEQVGRLRVIRELHEVTAHEMSVLISQADGARYAGAKDPKAAVRAAAVIGDSARTTLEAIRRVMTVVREGEAEVEVQPQLKSARELFKVMREAGLEITFEETGDRFEMKPGAELSIFRILQESLDNALTYGGPGTQVKVAFTWTDDGFGVVIDDDGVRAESRRQGLDPNEISRSGGYELEDDLSALTGVISGPGITEMRERTELFGGVFSAVQVPGVGFSVSASFPSLRYHNGVHGVKLDS